MSAAGVAVFMLLCVMKGKKSFYEWVYLVGCERKGDSDTFLVFCNSRRRGWRVVFNERAGSSMAATVAVPLVIAVRECEDERSRS
jgi:hypothetical protein